jgi:selenoprotein W-related protein
MTKVLPTFKQDIDGYEIIASGGGRFEIELDGKLLYSKLETGEFPDENEILAILKHKVGS